MKAFKLYLQKLNKTADILWQRPKHKIIDYDGEWYDAAPVGRDPLNSTMKEISKNAKLSMIYMNHCIRASVVTNLNDSGFEAHDIMATTGHKSESSIRSYAKKVPIKRRREVSYTLASKIIENNSKVAKKDAPATVTAPQKEQESNPINSYAELATFELFPEFEDQDLVDVLTQIEKENEQLETLVDKQNQNKVQLDTPKMPKTINFAAMTNISNINRTPVLLRPRLINCIPPTLGLIKLLINEQKR